MKDSNRILLGIILLVVGVWLILQQFGVNVPGLGVLWPFLIIFIAVINIIRGNIKGGLFLLFVGVVFQLSAIFGWGFWGTFWPLLIIVFGLIMLFGDSFGRIHKKELKTDKVDVSGFFAGNEEKVDSKDFKGGSVSSVFGSIKLDLRDAKLAKDGAEINVSCIFSGIEIFVPKDIDIKLQGTPILGSWERKFDNKPKKGSPVLKISGEAIFGSVHVMN